MQKLDFLNALYYQEDKFTEIHFMLLLGLFITINFAVKVQNTLSTFKTI
jgi:hypothetical protein